MAVLKLALPVEGATLDSGLEFQRGNTEVSLTAITPLSGWGYRKSITIDNTGNANALTDYQIRIDLDSTNFDFTKAKSDGSDVRITDSDGTTLLPFWIEKWDSANWRATIWTKVPSIPASSTYTIYLYYGNPSATSVSDPVATFVYYNDFEGDTVGLPPSGFIDNSDLEVYNDTAQGSKAVKNLADTSNFFNVPDITNLVLNAKMKHIGGSYIRLRFNLRYDLNSTNMISIGCISNNNRFEIYEKVAGTWYERASIPFTWGNIWHDIEIKLYENTVYATIDGSTISYNSLSVLSGGRTGLASWVGSLGAYDYIRIRKYTSPEPTTTVGTEEAGYPTNSPVSVFPEIDSGSSSTVWDMSSIVNRENLAGETGSIKYQYSCHNTSGSPVWNGTWLTLAQLQAEPDPTGRYFQLKAQFISDGSQDASLAEMYIGADVPVGVGTCDYPPESDVRQGVSYDNGTKTGTLIVPSASDVREGITFDNGTIGTLDLPAETDVRQGVVYDNGTKIGTLQTGASFELPLEVIDISDKYEVIEL